MKSLISKFFRPIAPIKDSSKTLAKAYEESHMTDLWEDTGEIYYLLDTLKLTFETEAGLVTYEKLSLESAKEVLEQLRQAQSKSFTQRVVAEQATEIKLTICGITWQALNGKTRIRAISDAAFLRASNPTFEKSQAVFQHADKLNSIDPAAITLPNQANVFTYNDISPDQFLTQISRINERLNSDLIKQINTTRENYLSPYSSHETQQIEKVLNATATSPEAISQSQSQSPD